MAKPAKRDAKPSPPVRAEPTSWEHFELWKRVQEAIRALPSHFRTQTNIEGVLATDIFTLNAVLGAMIEEQVVTTLNELRPVWDPERKYQACSFVRQAQTFPDVLLRKRVNGTDILLGIELKGWYLLAKEAMPNFRFLASPSACNPWDLIVIVPWALSNVLAGSPVAYAPFIELAKFAAEQRNHYWRHERETKGNPAISLATNVAPYPAKSDQISDKALDDTGGNFGRLARYGIMSAYVADMLQTELRGIPVRAWLEFLKRFAERPAPN
jgi:hypothetical protein